ncbi:MAG: phosphatase PAP2 family protein [Rhodospirillaceae bacterium]
MIVCDPISRRRLMVMLWVVVALACALLSMHEFDLVLSQAMRTLPGWVRGLSSVVTVAGLGKWYAWTLVVAFGLSWHSYGLADRERGRWYRRLAWALVLIFLAVALSAMVTEVIKVAVGRARPKLLEQVGFFGFMPLNFNSDFQSFPSGHATTGAAVGVALAFMVPKLRALLIAAAVAIAASRVVINAHFLADVIAGGAIGAATAWWLRELYADHHMLFERGPDGAVLWIGLTPPLRHQTALK